MHPFYGKRRLDAFELHKLQTEANIKRMKKENRLNIIKGSASHSDTTPHTSKDPEKFKKNYARQSKPNDKVLKDKTNVVDSLRRKEHNNVSKKIIFTDTKDHSAFSFALNSLNIHHRPLLVNKEVSQSKDPSLTVSNIRDTLIAFHKKSLTQDSAEQTEHSISRKKPLSIFELLSIIKKTKFTKFVRHGFNDRFLKISEEILSQMPYDDVDVNETLKGQANHYVRSFIEWFKLNKFDYVIVYKDLEHLRIQYQNKLLTPEYRPNQPLIEKSLNALLKNSSLKQRELLGMSRNLNNQKYIRREYRNDNREANPTHIVEDSRKIGKFVRSVQVKSFKEKETKLVLLMRTDVRFKIKKNDLLVLPHKSLQYQSINGVQVPIYMNWQIYKKRALDIDFFN